MFLFGCLKNVVPENFPRVHAIAIAIPKSVELVGITFDNLVLDELSGLYSMLNVVVPNMKFPEFPIDLVFIFLNVRIFHNVVIKL